MMNLRKLCLSLAATLAFSGAANAALITGTSGSTANTVTDYSTPALIAFDLDVQDFSGTRINFVLEDGDLLGPLSLNALVRNLSGYGLQHFTFSLQGIRFLSPGSVTPAFGTVQQIRNTGGAAAITFGAAEFAEFQFGNPFALTGSSDWILNTAGLQAGDSFSITATVPEPASLTLLLSALALFSVAAATRRRQD
jgi:hypothetical protein